MFILEVFGNVYEMLVNQFRSGFLNFPLENPLSYVYAVINFILQLTAAFGGGQP